MIKFLRHRIEIDILTAMATKFSGNLCDDCIDVDLTCRLGVKDMPHLGTITMNPHGS